MLVERGEYRENLEIVKDGIALLASGAVLRPPEHTQPRRCSTAIGLTENLFGLCVAGELDPGPEPTVRRPVRDVTVRGLAVQGFPLTGVVVFGGHRTRIEDNDLRGGTAYGLLVSLSTATVVAGNRVSGGDSAGIYIGNSAEAHARVTSNRITGAGLFGIYVRDSSHGTVVGNSVEGACVGVGFIATTRARGAVSDWRASANHLRRNNRLCQVGATLTGIGMLLAGTDQITISSNLVHDNEVVPGAAPWGGGIVLSGGRFGGPAESVDTHVIGNVLFGNRPSDITVLDPGIGTRIAHNICATSEPAGLCR